MTYLPSTGGAPLSAAVPFDAPVIYEDVALAGMAKMNSCRSSREQSVLPVAR